MVNCHSPRNPNLIRLAYLLPIDLLVSISAIIPLDEFMRARISLAIWPIPSLSKRGRITRSAGAIDGFSVKIVYFRPLCLLPCSYGQGICHIILSMPNAGSITCGVKYSPETTESSTAALTISSPICTMARPRLQFEWECRWNLL